MITALGTDDPAVRAVALGAAWRLNILDYKLLKAAFEDPSALVRRRALELAPRLGISSEPDRVALGLAVTRLLGDEDCAEVAAFALGELGVTVADIEAGLEHQAAHHRDPLCRESAVAALGALGIGRATVLGATADIATVRRRAIIALANFEGPDIELALEQALDDRDWQVRQAAEDLLRPPPED